MALGGTSLNFIICKFIPPFLSAMAMVISLLIGHIVKAYINMSLVAITSQLADTFLTTTTRISYQQVRNHTGIYLNSNLHVASVLEYTTDH